MLHFKSTLERVSARGASLERTIRARLQPCVRHVPRGADARPTGAGERGWLGALQEVARVGEHSAGGGRSHANDAYSDVPSSADAAPRTHAALMLATAVVARRSSTASATPLPLRFSLVAPECAAGTTLATTRTGIAFRAHGWRRAVRSSSRTAYVGRLYVPGQPVSYIRQSYAIDFTTERPDMGRCAVPEAQWGRLRPPGPGGRYMVQRGAE
jgi:hypothetical protein